VSTQPIRGPHRQLEVDAGALADPAERRYLQRLIHRLGLEGGGADVRCSEAAAIDGHRIALGDLLDKLRGDA
jgi:hypothetical protein